MRVVSELEFLNQIKDQAENHTSNSGKGHTLELYMAYLQESTAYTNNKYN